MGNFNEIHDHESRQKRAFHEICLVAELFHLTWVSVATVALFVSFFVLLLFVVLFCFLYRLHNRSPKKKEKKKNLSGVTSEHQSEGSFSSES